jgi:ribosome-associated protein
MDTESIQIRTESIAVDAPLKFAGGAGTGGEAKSLIQSEQVRVNGRIETHRGRRLTPGDRVEVLDPDGAIARVLRIEAEARPGQDLP